MVASPIRVAVTGATGFIGSHVLASLVRRGVDYRVLGRVCPADVADERFIRVDLLEDKLEERLFGLQCTHLIHLAWYAEHGRFWTSTANFDWAMATLALVRAFTVDGCHVTIAGSCAEYDWSQGLCVEGRTPLIPHTLYGQVKAATARLAAAASKSAGADCCWARIFLPFGPGESRERLIPAVIDALRGRRDGLTVGGDAWRDFMAVEDVADAIVHLSLGCYDGEVNVCSGEPRMVADVVQEIRSAIVNPIDTYTLDCGLTREGEPRWLFGDNGRLRSTGWEPLSPFSERLANYVRNYPIS